ncbi:GPI ethanolamine phosphate transferase 1 [Linum perenne]
MRSGGGILGAKGGGRRVSTDVVRRRKWLKRREAWLVILGVILHAVYMLSIFDIYFKTPIVHGMDPVYPRFTAPAKRLVLLVADGLRADKFYEPDLEGNYRAPFLRNIIRNQGRWGVSHARPPTESRPGHVALIAGFYEDPSAVTKGWKANPVEFDSVFNQSRHTFSYGSPDIVPIFCSALPHSTWKSYPHEFEDFATDASFLDEWSFDQFQSLLNRSHGDPKLKELLHQDKLVIFLHLLGCDSNGHAHRPFSSIYLNNVKVVDHIAERMYALLEDYYKDNRTTYIFTADHGMSDKGSHGDGHPTNTDTPLVAWGAGIKYPSRTSETIYSDHVVRFVDEHEHGTPTPIDWGLSGIERVDVNQADIAPLMSTLVGLPCPVNSVGNLPLGYISMLKAEEAEAVVANTKQILNQFLRKSEMKNSSSLYFKPFVPLANHTSWLEQIESLISIQDYGGAVKLSEDLRSLALQGLHYFQTYDWLMLMTIITLGYIGWMLYLVIHVLQSYASLARDIMKLQPTVSRRDNSGKVYYLGILVMAVVSILLILEHSPPLYHAYIAMTVFLWTSILGEYRFIRSLWRHLSERKAKHLTILLAVCSVSIIILELLVHSFTERELYTWCFITVGIAAPVYLLNKIPWSLWISVFVCATCWCLSVFTLMPAEIPDNTSLVVASGVVIVVIAAAARWLDFNSEGNKYWMNICYHGKEKLRFPMLFYIQALLVGLSSIMVPLSTSHRTEKQELHTWHQLINWFIAETHFQVSAVRFCCAFLLGLTKDLDNVRGRIMGVKPLPTLREAFSEVMATSPFTKEPLEMLKQLLDNTNTTPPSTSLHVTSGFSMILPLFSESGLLSRLTSIFLGFAPTFLLLSIGYEALFYGALSLVLMAWIIFENTLLQLTKAEKTSSSAINMDAIVTLENGDRCLQLSDMRIPLTFMVLFNVAFFGTGNFASIASFEISSVYRFITVFSPFLMAALLIFKLFIPFMLVICAFSAITKLQRVPRLGCYFLVIICSDVMTIHFFFLVRNTGSWMEIGNSISHFGIMSAQVVFVLLLFALTNVFTKGIEVRTGQPSSQKQVFNNGLELATSLVDSTLLDLSWSSIWNLYTQVNAQQPQHHSSPFPATFNIFKQPNLTVIAFVTSPIYSPQQQGCSDLVSSADLTQQNFSHLDFLCSKGNPSFSIHSSALVAFASLFNTLQSSLNQFLVSRDGEIVLESPLIVTGHSLGGSIASLFTLWLLDCMSQLPSKKPSKKLPLCITFGSPLIGDFGLNRGISQRSTWNSCFLHVVSSQDLLPKLLLTSSSVTSPQQQYMPFGTFMLCSELGHACVEHPQVVSLLFRKAMELTTTHLVSSDELPVQHYGSVLQHIKTRALCRGSSQLGFQIVDSLQAGIVLLFEAIGITQNQQQNPNIMELGAQLERKERLSMLSRRNAMNPSRKLNDIKIKMAFLEWYKKDCKNKGIGYYDSYKNQRGTADMDIAKHKKYLTNYWKEMVEEAEKKPQKEGSYVRMIWLYAGTAYRRMVEPLDIAEFYRENLVKERRRVYKSEGRSKHYILLEKWQKEDVAGKPETDLSSKKRNVDGNFTDDSCFWANVEEARVSCGLLKDLMSSEEERRIAEGYLVWFEGYVMENIRNYGLNPEVFLEQSSFMKWWIEFREIVGNNHHGNSLAEFMSKRMYRKYGSEF